MSCLEASSKLNCRTVSGVYFVSDAQLQRLVRLFVLITIAVSWSNVLYQHQQRCHRMGALLLLWACTMGWSAAQCSCSVLQHLCSLLLSAGAASMGPGSVHMADAEGSEISQDYSDLSSEYSYSSNDEADLGLAEATTTKERPPYRIIDAAMLKKVQVRSCCWVL